MRDAGSIAPKARLSQPVSAAPGLGRPLSSTSWPSKCERSHFDGQDVLESGLPKPGAAETGWLNRAFGAIEPASRIDHKGALAVGPVTPLVVRGPAPVLSWTP